MAAPATLHTAQIAAQNLRSDLDLTQDELTRVIDLAIQMKAQPRRYAKALEGVYATLLFEKPSLRTRLTFELAMKQLGGDSVTVVGPIADREPLKDVARNLARWTQVIVARTFTQDTVDQLAHWSGIPVVNALSDQYHPCQALADVMTIRERFGRAKVKIAYVGDGNNVAHSLMLTAARLGMDVALACPVGYEPAADVLHLAQQFAAANDATVTLTNHPSDAVANAHVVYTDVWASMGQESESQARQQIFAPYQVDAQLLAEALPEAIFLHCLPAKRGQEVTDEVVECPQSAVFDQAENRLHAQKALLYLLLH